MRRFAVLGLALALGAPASAASSTAPRTRTLATIPTGVSSFAQSDRYIAWITQSRKSRCAVLVMWDLRTGRRKSFCSQGEGSPGAMVLAGDRAYWESIAGSNLTVYTDLTMASAGRPRVKAVAYQSISSDGLDHLVPPASDGEGVYYWTSPEDATPGPIYRYGSRRARQMTATIPRLAALGAGEGRWAFARALLTFDCAQEPAWSPTGVIAYASAGRGGCAGGIWVASVGGGEQELLLPVGRNPDWSPSGDLAYDARDRVMVRDGAGRLRELTDRGTDPSWSPDGHRLAFVRDGSIFVVSSDGSGERVVVAEAMQPDWSPDGKQLVFARTDPKNPGLGIVSLEGGAPLLLTAGCDEHPAWSPDGRLIAYEHRCMHQILGIGPDGGGKRLLTDESDEVDDSGPCWEPDSQRLAFARSREWRDEGDSHVFTLQGQVTTTPPPRTPVEVRSAAGKALARLSPTRPVVEIAVTRRFTVALAHGRTWQLEFLTALRRTIKFWGARRVSSLSASGRRAVVLVDGRKIFLVDARTGSVRLIARASTTALGLSIVGRRIAWAENLGRRARIRAVTLPR